MRSANGQSFRVPVAICLAVICQSFDNVARFGLNEQDQAQVHAYDAAIAKQTTKGVTTIAIVGATAPLATTGILANGLLGGFVSGTVSAKDQFIDTGSVDPVKMTEDAATGGLAAAGLTWAAPVVLGGVRYLGYRLDDFVAGGNTAATSGAQVSGRAAADMVLDGQSANGATYTAPNAVGNVGGAGVADGVGALEQRGLSKLDLPRTQGLGSTSTTAELLQTGAIPGREGVVLTQPRVGFDDLWQLSERSGVEFVLTRENSQFVLRSGSATSAPIPAGGRPIVHTHPLDADGLNSLLPSRADINVLNRYWADNPTLPRPVSQIITGPNQTTIFRSTGLDPWRP